MSATRMTIAQARKIAARITYKPGTRIIMKPDAKKPRHVTLQIGIPAFRRHLEIEPTKDTPLSKAMECFWLQYQSVDLRPANESGLVRYLYDRIRDLEEFKILENYRYKGVAIYIKKQRNFLAPRKWKAVK